MTTRLPKFMHLKFLISLINYRLMLSLFIYKIHIQIPMPKDRGLNVAILLAILHYLAYSSSENFPLNWISGARKDHAEVRQI